MSFHPWRALAFQAKAALYQRRWIEFGFHGLHQIFSGVLCAAQARLFFSTSRTSRSIWGREDSDRESKNF
jgi:hypothetical protein